MPDREVGCSEAVAVCHNRWVVRPRTQPLYRRYHYHYQCHCRTHRSSPEVVPATAGAAVMAAVPVLIRARPARKTLKLRMRRRDYYRIPKSEY